MRKLRLSRAAIEATRGAAIIACETRARSARELALGCDPGTLAAIGSSAAAAAYGAGAWLARRVAISPSAPTIEPPPATPRRAITHGKGKRQ